MADCKYTTYFDNSRNQKTSAYRICVCSRIAFMLWWIFMLFLLSKKCPSHCPTMKNCVVFLISAIYKSYVFRHYMHVNVYVWPIVHRAMKPSLVYGFSCSRWTEKQTNKATNKYNYCCSSWSPIFPAITTIRKMNWIATRYLVLMACHMYIECSVLVGRCYVVCICAVDLTFYCMSCGLWLKLLSPNQ